MADRGVAADWFNESYRKFYPELADDWPEFFPQLRERGRQYLETLNYSYLAALDSITAEDQRVRLGGKVTKETRPVDSTNMLALLSLFERYGFPSFSELKPSSPYGGRPPYYYPLLHEAKKISREGDRFGLLPLLLRALEEGRLNSHTYAQLMVHARASMGGMGEYGETVVVTLQEPGDTLYRIVKSPEQIALINENRGRIGLTTYDERVARYTAYHSGTLDRRRFFIPRSRVRISYPPFLREQLELEPVGHALPFEALRY
jgi:hypothetical protein